MDPHAERICLRGDTDFSLNFDRREGRLHLRHGRSAAQGSGRSLLATARAPRYETLTGQRATLPGRREGAHRPRAGLRQLGAELRDVAEFSYQPSQPSGSGSAISKMKGEHGSKIRLLLHHDPHGSQRRGSGPVRQRALRPGEHHRAAQERRQRAAGPPIRSGQQLGLHGHRISVVRPDDAPKERPQRVHPHGVPALHPQHHPDPMPRHAPGSHHHPPADRRDRFFSAWRTIERTGFG